MHCHVLARAAYLPYCGRGLKLILLHCRSLNSNNLRSVPSSLGRLTRLTRLSLHINQLETLPSELSRLTRMEALCALN